MIEIQENKVQFDFDKNKLIGNFNKYNGLGNVYYPIKTNSNTKVLEVLYKLNSGFLITTLNNFEKIKELNIDMSKVCLINVLAEKETVKYYYDNGVRFFTFDNMNSLVEFSKYADLSKVKIVIRLSTMQIFEDEFTHLGSSLEETLDMINFLKGKCDNYGIAFYIQHDLKQKENVLENIFNYIAKKYSNLGLKFANIGGVSLINKKELISKFKLALKLDEIILEIGRDLVQDTMEIETRIIREKTINNKKIITIKNGIYSGFFHAILYGKKFPMYLKVGEDRISLEYQKVKETDCEILVCGGSSESGDKIGTVYIDTEYKDKLVEGAKIIIKDAGAYFEEFFMSYGSDLVTL